MRILHFCNYADRLGGAEVYAHAVVDGLRARGHEVALFGASPEREVDQPGLRVIRRPLHDHRRLVRDPAALSALTEYVQRFRPEVVHAHNVFSVALEVVDYLGQCEVPLLQTVHDFQLLCPNSWCVRGDGTPCPGGAGAQCFEHRCQENHPYDSWSVLLAAVRQRLVARGTRAAVAPSRYLADRLRAHGWQDVRHLPYFVELEPPPPDTSRSEGEMICVGRLQPEKGVDVLLRAMPAIRAALPAARLTVIGDGPRAGALRRQASELGLDPAVRFLPRLPRPELAQFYARAALCVLPSVWAENSPLVAYECLLSGLPVVGSRIGGIPELIEGGCGFTFEPRDPRDLARAVVRFFRLPGPERERMSAEAARRGRSFDRDDHLSSLERIYAEILTAPPVRGDDALLGPDLFTILQHVGADRNVPPQAATPLEILRSFARRLGLPKVFRE